MVDTMKTPCQALALAQAQGRDHTIQVVESRPCFSLTIPDYT